MLPPSVEEIIVSLIAVVGVSRFADARAGEAGNSSGSYNDGANRCAGQEAEPNVAGSGVNGIRYLRAVRQRPAETEAGNVNQVRAEDVALLKGRQSPPRKIGDGYEVIIIRPSASAVIYEERAAHRIFIRELVIHTGGEEIFGRHVTLNQRSRPEVSRF